MNSQAAEATPKPRRHWALLGYAVGGSLLGLLLLVWIWHQQGAQLRGQDLAAILPILPWVALWYVLPIAAAGWSWRYLLPRRPHVPLKDAILFTWIGLGVNWLLPVAMIGGEMVKMRLGLRLGLRATPLVASLVGDKTLQVASQGLYTLLGLALLVTLSDSSDGIWESFAGLTLFAAAIYLFYWLQNAGLFSGLAAKLARFSKNEQTLNLRAVRLDACVRGMYRRRRRWWLAASARMLFRLLMAGEIWIVMHWQGIDLSLAQILVLESLAQGARAAAFMIPAGIGAQEAGLLAVGAHLGLPVEALVLLAVVKRLRELLVGGVALLSWQAMEGHWWLRRRRG